MPIAAAFKVAACSGVTDARARSAGHAMSDVHRFDGRLAVIGGGRMGEAIVAGLLSAGTMSAADIAIAEPSELRRTQLADAHSVRVMASGAEAVAGASVVILAIKPQIMDAVVRELSGSLAGTLVVSIAAGITCARLESLLPDGTRVVRVMPNTPALVGEGMALVSGGTDATASDVDSIAGLFSAIGRSTVIEERYQDPGTAISGSGPAYFALVIDALARAGVAEGLPRATAQALAIQTMLGTARMLEQTGMHPEELIDGVASPGGTTIAAINVLEAKGVRAAFAKAVSKAVRRARELGA